MGVDRRKGDVWQDWRRFLRYGIGVGEKLVGEGRFLVCVKIGRGKMLTAGSTCIWGGFNRFGFAVLVLPILMKNHSLRIQNSGVPSD